MVLSGLAVTRSVIGKAYFRAGGIGILLIVFMTQLLALAGEADLMVAPMGASAALLFAVIHDLLSQ